jgi:hypothetical protein
MHFFDDSRLQHLATGTPSSAGRDHCAEQSVLALGIRFNAEWLLKHFMIAQAINCPRKRGNSKTGKRYQPADGKEDI